MPAARGSSIGALARASGVNLETIRYYERIGLMAEPARTEGGHRVYEPQHERRLAFIRRGRELGFGIEEIRTLLRLEQGGDPCGPVRELASAHLKNVRAKIADLQRLEALLAGALDRCDASSGAPTCAVLEMLDADR